MKKVLALLMSAALVFSLTGCSLFTSGGGEGGEGGGGGASGDVKITDEYTHKAPEGLEYETRYAYWSGDECSLVEMFKTYYDVNITAEYIVIYANKDDKAVAQYTYFVMASEEDAQKFMEVSTGTADDMQAVGNVIVQVMDEEAMTDTIDSFIAMNVLEDTSAAKYAAMQKEMDMLIDYDPQ